MHQLQGAGGSSYSSHFTGAAEGSCPLSQQQERCRQLMASDGHKLRVGLTSIAVRESPERLQAGVASACRPQLEHYGTQNCLAQMAALTRVGVVPVGVHATWEENAL